MAAPWRDSPDELADREEIRDRLDQAMAQLSPSLRAVFQLRDVEDRSTAETAAILGITEAAAKVRVHRARLRLREELGASLGLPELAAASTTSCEAMIDYLSDYIDGDLDGPLAREARDHIATCRHCHIVHDTTRDTITLYRQHRGREVPKDRQARLIEALGQRARARTHHPIRGK